MVWFTGCKGNTFFLFSNLIKIFLLHNITPHKSIHPLLSYLEYEAKALGIVNVVPHPVCKYRGFVFDAQDGADVNHKPENPGKETSKLKPAYLHHSLAAAYSGHSASILIAEHIRLPAVL